MHRTELLLRRRIHVNCNESNVGLYLPSYAIIDFVLAYEGILLRLLVFSLFLSMRKRYMYFGTQLTV